MGLRKVEIKATALKRKDRIAIGKNYHNIVAMNWPHNQVFVSARSVIIKLFSLTTQFGLLAFLLASCATTDVAGNGSSASVLISGHTEEQVRNTAIDVFGWNNYNRLGDLNFEKEGSWWDTAKYGGIDTKTVWIKMGVSVNSLDNEKIVLSCDAYVIENHGDGFIQTERKLPFAKREECKKILDQIKQRLSLPASQTN